MSDDLRMMRFGRGKALMVAAVPVVVAAVVGNLATIPNIAPWYAGLVKPWFNPPNGVFGPAWTTLYVLMIFAFGRVLARAPEAAGRGRAIAWFLVQIALNAAWSVAFFAGHSPAAGLVVIALLWPAIAVTIRAFAAVDRVAAWLLAPYLAWVSFAAVLNAAVWRLN
jgi:tryptophan-rich sensory protein